MRLKANFQHAQSGSALVGAICALVVVVIMGAGVQGFMRQGIDAAENVAQPGRKADARRYTEARFDCDKTMGAAETREAVLKMAKVKYYSPTSLRDAIRRSAQKTQIKDKLRLRIVAANGAYAFSEFDAQGWQANVGSRYVVYAVEVTTVAQRDGLSEAPRRYFQLYTAPRGMPPEEALTPKYQGQLKVCDYDPTKAY